MRALLHLAAPLALCIALVAGAPPAGGQSSKHYVCPPCGQPCDTTIFDKPGICPACGMALVDQDAAQAAAPVNKKVAMLLFNGVEIIDYTGPWEVFGGANFDVFSVAATKEPVTTAMGMKVVPNYTFADAPRADVLLVPGGGVHAAEHDAATLKWVRDESEHTEQTMSVCNGAFILAGAGLLDGLSATTTYHLIGKLRDTYPKTKVVDDQRFVDNGKIITTAGLSAGIDGALHVVSKLMGEGTAQQVALGLEYDWRPNPGFARGALADRLIPDLDLTALGKWEVLSTHGGTDRWEIAVRATSNLSAAELGDRLGDGLSSVGKWSRIGASSGSPLTSQWKFNDKDGKPWTGTMTIQADAGDKHQYTAKVAIARAG